MPDTFYMELALKEAWKYQFLTYPNPAVGACVVGKHGEILSVAAHEQAGEAHAEVNALLKAFTKLQPNAQVWGLFESQEIHDYLILHHDNLFKDVTLYTTLAPCNHIGKTPSCTSLIQKLGIKCVVVGSLDQHSTGGVELLEASGVEVQIGVKQKACDELLEPFLVWQSGRPFNFFKMGQHLNGTYDGGVITNEASRYHVHQLRSKVDALIIGGNTVRIDRPRLDTRLLSNGRDPHVKIYSQHKDFDQDIPLFQIPDRNVVITNKKEELLSDTFSMIEGGEGTFKALKSDINWILLYVSGTMAPGIAMQAELDAKILHIQPMEDNFLIWMKHNKG